MIFLNQEDVSLEDRLSRFGFVSSCDGGGITGSRHHGASHSRVKCDYRTSV